MSLNETKPTYGTVPAVENSGTKGSRRGVVVGLVRPRARKSIHGAFMSTESSHRARRHRRDVFASQAAAACFAIGFAAAKAVGCQLSLHKRFAEAEVCAREPGAWAKTSKVNHEVNPSTRLLFMVFRTVRMLQYRVETMRDPQV